MINYLISLLASFLNVQYLNFWFFPLIALAFLTVIPFIIRLFVKWR